MPPKVSMTQDQQRKFNTTEESYFSKARQLTDRRADFTLHYLKLREVYQPRQRL